MNSLAVHRTKKISIVSVKQRAIFFQFGLFPVIFLDMEFSSVFHLPSTYFSGISVNIFMIADFVQDYMIIPMHLVQNNDIPVPVFSGIQMQ